MEHSFDIETAKKYGVNAAILYRNFQYWIAKNKADGRNLKDGRTWTYNSRRGLTDLFPYLSDWDVRHALKRLVDEDVLITAKYSKKGYDRTTWYAFRDEKTALKSYPAHWRNSPMGEKDEKPGCESHQPIGESHQPIGESHQPIGESHQPIGESHQPITNPKPNSKPGNKPNTNEIDISSDEILGLDLKIAEQNKLFMGETERILRPRGGEVKTFARISAHMVRRCQAGELPVSIFKDAIEWAKQAKCSNVPNKKGLFVAKIKEKTDFKAQVNMLSTGASKNKSPTRLNTQEQISELFKRQLRAKRL